MLRRVLVFRGLPSPEHDPDGYDRNQAQKAHWERDRRVTVTLRPLKYEYQRAADGRPASDIYGRRIVKGKQEKGVDVLCALAAVRESQDPATDLVIVASSDTDLAPALDEVRRLGQAKVETFCWYDKSRHLGYQLHPTDRSLPVWNTRFGWTSAAMTTRYQHVVPELVNEASCRWRISYGASHTDYGWAGSAV